MHTYPDLSEEIDLADWALSPLVDALRAWTSSPAFVPLAVPPAFARLEGSAGGIALSLETWRFAHRDLLHLTWALLREADSGACRAVTLYALPVPGTALPILGCDYVGFAGQLTLAALDLAPTDPAFWLQAAQPLLSELRADREGLIERKLPAFAADVFSPLALLAAAKSPEACRRAVDHALRVLNSYAGWLAAPTIRPALDERLQAARLDAWCRAMAGNKKEAGALARIFGSSAKAYLEDFLFAARVPASPGAPEVVKPLSIKNP